MSRAVSVMKYSFAMSLSAVLLALSFTPAVSAQEQLTNREQEEFLAEASKQLGIDEALIERSIAMSDYAGGLEEELLERFPELHSAVSIDVPNSTIQIHAKQTSAKSSEFNAILNDRKHPYRVVYVPTQTSEEEREKIINSVKSELRKAGIAADLEGNAYLDKVVVTVTKDDSKKVENLRSTLEKNVSSVVNLGQGRAKPNDLIQFQTADELAAPTAIFRGGNHLTSCTAGLPVQNASGQRFMTTAGHCTGTQHAIAPAAIQTTTVIAYDTIGSRDVRVQSLVGSGNSIGNGLRYKNSSGTWLSQSITATKSRSSVVLGEIVCKVGKTIPSACGTVETKTYLPSYQTNGEATFIRATAQSESGDSGGPVFRQSTAFGLTSGKTSAGHLIFMSVTYMPPGYSVVTGS